MCHVFRITNRDDCYWVTFDHFRNNRLFWAAGEAAKIVLSLKPNHYITISNFNQVKLVQIPATLCSTKNKLSFFAASIPFLSNPFLHHDVQQVHCSPHHRGQHCCPGSLGPTDQLCPTATVGSNGSCLLLSS